MNIHKTNKYTTRELLNILLTQPSVTPDKTNCLTIIKNLLTQHGFVCENVVFGEVNNLWAVHNADKVNEPLLVLGGHTDVVQPGDGWNNNPFIPTEHDGYLFARGVADMKTGVVTMIQSALRFINNYPDYPGRIAVMITADEEGSAINGIRKLMPYLSDNGIKIDYALFTEPTSDIMLGDTIKNGRRGSLHGTLKVIGVQGHVAYPNKALNPIHVLSNIVTELMNQTWCDGNKSFPATSLQFSNFHSGMESTNIIPSDATVKFNFRYSNEIKVQELKKSVKRIIERNLTEHSSEALFFKYQLNWVNSADPFLTVKGEIINAMVSACEEILDITPKLSTSGGTSDARFVAPYGIQVIEFGVINETIHQVNESVNIDDIARVEDTYLRFYEHLFKLL